MYIPSVFEEHDQDIIWSLIEAHPFALLISHDVGGIHATHLPLLADRPGRRLAGHIARPNPQPARTQGEAMVVINGPQAYISPGWYPSKARDPRAVPTWNYEAVHLYGRILWRDEADWKRRHLTALSDRFERRFEHPWSLTDAPDDYVEMLLRGIVGLEFAIDRIEAKRKLSQNRPADFEAVIEGLRSTGLAGDAEVAQAMEKLDRT